ncbi:MAG: phosphoribosylanthranilate isomerase [Gammaproteobacteria bacterium]|nr:MAG: phosphoribosylanthranilate isomerase [Gammaproteobacteria bacterium]
MRIRIKICGITRLRDALTCAELGIDAIGLVFYERSPRHIEPEAADTIVRRLPPFMSTVGLFMNADRARVEAVMKAVRLDNLQFHGDESPEFCEQFNIPYIKAIPMGEDSTFSNLVHGYESASAWLLDSHRRNKAGGSGETFDWLKVPGDAEKPLILAGGLNADNVQSAIAKVRPYAVDCSSGVEVEPGVKDPEKIRDFMEKVTSV